MRPGTAGLLCLALALPAAVDAQVGVASLDGGWVRVDSNNQPNDRMRIRVQGGRALLTYVPETGHAGFRNGQVLWQGIGADGALQVRGSNGQYYPATLRLEGDELLLEVKRAAAGDQQRWRRSGPSIDGDWVRIDTPGEGDDGMRVRVEGDRAAIRYLPATSSRRFRVGTRLWQEIGSGGAVQVMGDDGRHRPARITLIPRMGRVAGAERSREPPDPRRPAGEFATNRSAPWPASVSAGWRALAARVIEDGDQAGGRRWKPRNRNRLFPSLHAQPPHPVHFAGEPAAPAIAAMGARLPTAPKGRRSRFAGCPGGRTQRTDDIAVRHR